MKVNESMILYSNFGQVFPGISGSQLKIIKLIKAF